MRLGVRHEHPSVFIRAVFQSKGLLGKQRTEEADLIHSIKRASQIFWETRL